VRVAIISDVAAPYRVELFESLRRVIPDIRVFIQGKFEAFRSWEVRPELPFAHDYLRGYGLRLGSRQILVYPSLSGHLSGYAADVVLAYGFGTASIQCARYAARTSIPLILANDGTLETDPRSGVEGAYRRTLVRQASGFIAASDGGVDYFLALGAPEGLIRVVRLTRDLEGARKRAVLIRRTRTTMTSAEPEYKLAMVARLLPAKRILDGCRAALLVARHLPNLYLTIAGDGPLMSMVADWVDQNGEGKIGLVGTVSWDELIGLYARSDILLFPATREKYGMVVIEAMACGVPVIAYRNAGATELIEDGRNGFVVEQGDIESMAMRSLSVLSDGSRLQEMQQKAQDAAVRHDVRIEAERLGGAIAAFAGRRSVREEDSRKAQLSLGDWPA
jgi:glycosyltransferase involved in cell wall biosynthesis